MVKRRRPRTASAARHWPMASASIDGTLSFIVTEAKAVRRPLVRMRSLAETGTAASAPKDPPALRRASRASAAVRAAAIFARESANLVRWEIDKAGIVISANSPQIGENQIKVEAKVQGKGGKIAFNSRYLLEMLGAIKSKELKLEMTGGLNPGVFKMMGDETWVHIIMPVRVQDTESSG